MVFLAGKEEKMKIFSMYSGLRREIYILCFGRFVTAMGSLIWPMLTLILKSKLGYDAEQVALWFLIFGIVQIPLGLIGGKLTDRYNKRNLIIVFDLISVLLYAITAFLPLSTFSICIYYIGSLFQHMEWPAYDALIAELTKDTEREKAYSLQYLAANLGVVFAPTLGGLLFNKYLWLSFLIAGGAVFSSTMLIYRFVPRNTEKVENNNTYEKHSEGNLWDVIKKRKLLIGYLVINCMVSIVYAQFNYMLPMQMDDMFGVQGAVYFGMMTSVNGGVVILFTPILTQLTLKWKDLQRIQLGTFLEVVGVCSCAIFGKNLTLYFCAMVLFTLGEVLHTIGHSPYLSKRIPDSHRGRFTSFNNILRTLSSSAGNTVVGKIIVMYSFVHGWIAVFVFGLVLSVFLMFYRKLDRKEFALLYK